MSVLSGHVRSTAAEIIEDQTRDRVAPEELAASLEAVFERLHHLMSPLVGHVGFAAVMLRAVHLSKADCPCLEKAALEIREKPRLTGFAEIIQRKGAAHCTNCATYLLANVIGLLCAFIGDDLTYRVLRRAWPNLPERNAGIRWQGTLKS